MTQEPVLCAVPSFHRRCAFNFIIWCVCMPQQCRVNNCLCSAYLGVKQFSPSQQEPQSWNFHIFVTFCFLILVVSWGRPTYARTPYVRFFWVCWQVEVYAGFRVAGEKPKLYAVLDRDHLVSLLLIKEQLSPDGVVADILGHSGFSDLSNRWQSND